MSWITDIQTDFTITTGDGKAYKVDWLVATLGIEYNVAVFEFKEVGGSLAKRGKPKGTKYNLEVFFQGENHLVTGKAFIKSAANSKAWTINHPYYGNLLVQPLSLVYDNSIANVTKVQVPVIETIGVAKAGIKVSAPDKITNDVAKCSKSIASNYITQVPAPKVNDIQALQKTVNQLYNTASSTISDTVDFETYYNIYNQCNTLLNTTIYDANALITQTQELILAPAAFAQTVKDRLKLLIAQLAALTGSIANTASVGVKVLYEATAGTIINAMALSSITNIGTAYTDRNNVLQVVDTIVKAHNDYMTQLDTLQSVNGGAIHAYIPDVTATTDLSVLVSYTVGSLMEIANDSKQQRTLYLNEDTNLIVLAHELYGISADNSELDTLIEQNNIGINELLVLKKGRAITYYV
jgi:hypothetical protein